MGKPRIELELRVYQTRVLTVILFTLFMTIDLVRVKGLEPPRLAASDPKSDAATITPHPEFGRILELNQASY